MLFRSDLAALMHSFAGVAGNMGAEHLYERSSLLSQRFKKAEDEKKPPYEIQAKDDLNALIDETRALLLAINQATKTPENQEEVVRQEQSKIESQEKITRLSDLIRENNPEAATYANQILAAYLFSEAEHAAILEAAKQLEQFEFEQALSHISALQHA